VLIYPGDRGRPRASGCSPTPTRPSVGSTTCSTWPRTPPAGDLGNTAWTDQDRLPPAQTPVKIELAREVGLAAEFPRVLVGVPDHYVPLPARHAPPALLGGSPTTLARPLLRLRPAGWCRPRHPKRTGGEGQRSDLGCGARPGRGSGVAGRRWLRRGRNATQPRGGGAGGLGLVQPLLRRPQVGHRGDQRGRATVSAATWAAGCWVPGASGAIIRAAERSAVPVSLRAGIRR